MIWNVVAALEAVHLRELMKRLRDRGSIAIKSIRNGCSWACVCDGWCGGNVGIVDVGEQVGVTMFFDVASSLSDCDVAVFVRRIAKIAKHMTNRQVTNVGAVN